MARGAASEARWAAGFCLRLALAWCFAAQLLVGQAAASSLAGPGSAASGWTICHNNRSEPAPAPTDTAPPAIHACCVPGLCALPLGPAPAGLALAVPLVGPLELAASAETAPAPALRWRPLYARPPPAST
jgi:hypothetical protein